MYISDIRIENFRLFGAGADAFRLSLNPGLTALVGENDAGKTAVVDALRFVLGTRDQDSMRLERTDFHHAPSGDLSDEITIRLTFSGLTSADRVAFAEYLTYLDSKSPEVVMILTWVARRAESAGTVRRFVPVEFLFIRANSRLSVAISRSRGTPPIFSLRTVSQHDESLSTASRKRRDVRQRATGRVRRLSTTKNLRAPGLLVSEEIPRAGRLRNP